MILSERDWNFLKDLYFVKILNTQRICRLYNSKKYCYSRLKLLKDNGYIKVLYKLPSKENVFTLDKKGYETIGYKSKKLNINLEYSLAAADFYFHEKRLDAFIKFNNKYYFRYQNRKYILKIDILMKTNTWIFVELDLGDKHFEDKIKKWEMYYKSKEYKKLFDNFPVIAIVSSDIDRTKKIIEDNKREDVLYQYLDYQKVKEWKYHYSQNSQ
ncbi:hypothetical protein [Clostridium ganghwense]|uniref:Replication-relaxation n=1 Tax=Clostridium ganghwense TaxID=312089 RepID=A0ABT4CTV0_9CLOT|nr:hypothetical protein [Clostridium ganghwense]MCY6372492.1 hypothetical protein [Clostridium ganghwense]